MRCLRMTKNALLWKWAGLRKQADHKAECYCEADARSDWADCACIAPCAAFTKAHLLPFWTERLLELEECSEWKRYEVRLERTARKTPFFLEL